MKYHREWHRDTMTQLMHGAMRGAMNEPRPDHVLNIESHFLDTTLLADSCIYDIDLGRDVWLNKQRWSRLIREYVPREPLERFINQAQEIMSGAARKGATANMMFRDPARYEKKHRWGGCLMGATFHAGTETPMLTFYSRTSYMGYMALLDAGIAHVMAREIGDHENIAFRWHLSSMQLHHFKSLPFIFSQPDLFKQLTEWDEYELDDSIREEMTPAWWYITKWYHKVLEAYEEHGTDMLEHEKYGPFKRIKRRWLEHMRHVEKGAPPSQPISELTFEKADDE